MLNFKPDFFFQEGLQAFVLSESFGLKFIIEPGGPSDRVHKIPSRPTG